MSKRACAYVVFSQRSSTEPDASAWAAHAARFFGVTLTVAADGMFRIDGAGARRVSARARTDDDLEAATRADRDDTGLARLARRCPTVWIVERESDDDPVARRIAAILASVLLGPILDARASTIFGVKTARALSSR